MQGNDAHRPETRRTDRGRLGRSPAQITDPDTGEIIPAFLFIGVLTYSQYPYVEAFTDEK